MRKRKEHVGIHSAKAEAYSNAMHGRGNLKFFLKKQEERSREPLAI